MAQGARKIHKVPPLLRQHNSDAFDPKVVSFGPYHHGKEELRRCEEAKLLSVEKFVHGSGKDRAFFKQKIMDVIADARNCYVEGSTDHYTDDAFAEMMLLDACFHIGGLPMSQNWEYDHFIYQRIGEHVLPLVTRDMILLENQIPFSIVTLLIKLRYGSEGEAALNNSVHFSIWGQNQPNVLIGEKVMQQLPLHLLEAFHRVLVWDPTLEIPVQIDNNVDMRTYYRNFRSAKDLKASGIYFQHSPNKSLKDINFVSGPFYGELQLPVWCVSRLSKVFFPNMTAYELCPENRAEKIVIPYLDFMKRLIKSPADVKELREKNILKISLGSDKEVVKLFKEQYTSEVASIFAFQNVEKGVQEHCDRVRRTWIAELIHTYIRSPWTVAGVLAMLGVVLAVYKTFHK